MSFRDLEKGPTAGRASGRQPLQGKDPEESFDEGTIKGNILELQECVRDFGARLTRGLLSRRRVEGVDQCLARSRGLVEETERAFRDWTVRVAGEPAETHRTRFLYEKLRGAFEHEVIRLKEVARQVVAIQQEARAADQKRNDAEVPCFCEEQCPSSEEDAEAQGLFGREAAQERPMDAAIQSQIVQEREEGVLRIQGQVYEVKQIVKELASICQEQGQHLQTIEQHVEESATHVRRATVQLKAAAERQGSARERLCCLLFLGLVVFFVVLLPRLLLLAGGGPGPAPASAGLVLGSTLLLSDGGALPSPWGFGDGADGVHV